MGYHILLTLYDPNICMQILPTDLYTFLNRNSWENLIEDQSIFPLVIILSILTAFSLDLSNDNNRRKWMFVALGTWRVNVVLLILHHSPLPAFPLRTNSVELKWRQQPTKLSFYWKDPRTYNLDCSLQTGMELNKAVQYCLIN